MRSAGIAPALTQQLPTLLEAERNNCFYFPVHTGMSMQAAAILEERNVQNKQLRSSNRRSIIALCIAGISSACAALAIIISLVSN